MKNIFRAILLAASMIGMTVANAADFNYVEASYAAQDVQNRSADSWGVAFSKEVGSKLYVLGSYEKGIDSDLRQGVAAVGVGFHTPVATAADIYAQVEATTVVADRKDVEKYGYRAESGIRWQVADSWEMRGGVLASNLREAKLDAVEWRAYAGVEYALTKYVRLSATAEGKHDELEGKAAVRLYF